jgi:pyridoxal/pyridoxine/pyridoxamine kinase
MLQRLLNLTAAGAKNPMHSTGSEVSRLAREPLIPNASWIVPSMGETEVMTGRKLREARKSAIIKKIKRMTHHLHPKGYKVAGMVFYSSLK